MIDNGLLKKKKNANKKGKNGKKPLSKSNLRT